MYNLLVVDDEQHVRESVRAILEGLDGAQMTVYEAGSGAAALRMMEERRIDAAILDIRMPVMDGIELLRAIRERRERALVALLTGHDEFEYAQAALAGDAMAYLLKPVDRREIVKLYYRFLHKLKARDRLEREMARLMQRADEIRPFLRQRFYADWVRGRLDEGAFHEMRAHLRLNLDNRPMRFCLIEVDENESQLALREDDGKLNLYSVLEAVERVVAVWPHCDSFPTPDNAIALVWCPPGSDGGDAALLEDVELLCEEMLELYGAVLNVGVGARVSGPAEAERALATAAQALRHKLLYGAGQVYDHDALHRDGEERSLVLDSAAAVEGIWRGDAQEARGAVDACFAALRRDPGSVSLTSIQLFCQKLLIDSLVALERECGPDAVERFLQERDGNLLEIRFARFSLGEIQSFFAELVEDICRSIARSRDSERKRTIARAKAMIAAGYAGPIGLSTLARDLHFSKNYFGQVFKAETGMTVNEYINHVRIQRAKELLADGTHKIYEVAELVGYRDQGYFARIFKKTVGCMPSEYGA